MIKKATLSHELNPGPHCPEASVLTTRLMGRPTGLQLCHSEKTTPHLCTNKPTHFKESKKNWICKVNHDTIWNTHKQTSYNPNWSCLCPNQYNILSLTQKLPKQHFLFYSPSCVKLLLYLKHPCITSDYRHSIVNVKIPSQNVCCYN